MLLPLHKGCNDLQKAGLGSKEQDRAGTRRHPLYLEKYQDCTADTLAVRVRAGTWGESVTAFNMAIVTVCNH